MTILLCLSLKQYFAGRLLFYHATNSVGALKPVCSCKQKSEVVVVIVRAVVIDKIETSLSC